MILTPDDVFIEINDWFVVSIECSSGLFIGHDRNLFADGSSRTHCCYTLRASTPLTAVCTGEASLSVSVVMMFISRSPHPSGV
jgi:hypothetical protein